MAAHPHRRRRARGRVAEHALRADDGRSRDGRDGPGRRAAPDVALVPARPERRAVRSERDPAPARHDPSRRRSRSLGYPMKRDTRVNHPPEITLPDGNRPLVTPIHRSVKFTYPTIEDSLRPEARLSGFEYTRDSNPTTRELELLCAE